MPSHARTWRAVCFALLVVSLLALIQLASAQVIKRGAIGRKLPAPAQPTAGQVLISEFRLDGPNGFYDEFMEFYNNTDQDIIVAASDGSGGWAVGLARLCGICPTQEVVTTYFTIPDGTLIPARRHLLWTNTYTDAGNVYRGYSLKDYGGTNAAAGDLTFNGQTYTVDFGDGHMNGVALFTSTNPANWSLATRLDAVGAQGGTNPLFIEGTGVFGFFGDLSANSSSSVPQYALVRRQASGVPQDTDNNANDFDLVSNIGSITTDGPGSTFNVTLGAPGPENTQSPIQRNATIKAALIDSGCTTTTVGPNATPTGGTCPRVRDVTPATNAANGTLSIRRAFKNSTGQSVTRLRFRIVDITTLNSPGGPQADLRALSSNNVSAVCVSTGLGCPSAGAPVTINGTTLEQPPTQSLGGGLNSSLAVGTITMTAPLASGATINLQFLLGVQQGGTYRFLVNVEALP